MTLNNGGVRSSVCAANVEAYVDNGKTSGPGDLLQAMRQAAVPEWKNAAGLGRQKEVELGRARACTTI